MDRCKLFVIKKFYRKIQNLKVLTYFQIMKVIHLLDDMIQMCLMERLYFEWVGR